MPTTELSAWFNSRARPIWEAHYAQDIDGARGHFDAALEEARNERDSDLRQAKVLRLGSAWLFVLAELGSRDDFAQFYTQLLDALREGNKGPLSAALLPVTEAMARMHADALGVAELHSLQLLRLLREVPEDTRGPNFWNLAAEWAFRHSDAQLLEEAYVFFTTHAPSVMADQMFARLRLMRGLRDGTATEKDVLETVGRMEVLSQMWDFERLLLPECEAQGLLSPDVGAEIEARKHTLEAIGKHAPQKR
jgi:hypothetical protein